MAASRFLSAPTLTANSATKVKRRRTICAVMNCRAELNIGLLYQHEAQASDSKSLACASCWLRRSSDGGGFLVAGVEFDADTFADAGFLHGDAVEDVGDGHGSLRVGDDNELRKIEEVDDDAVEALIVGFVQSGVDFVEDGERRRPA